MKVRDNQPEITSEKLFATLKQSRKSLIAIALFFIVIALLVKIGIKSSVGESSTEALDSIALHKMSLIRQYAKSVKLSDLEVRKVEKSFIRFSTTQKLLSISNDSLVSILNQKVVNKDTIGTETIQINLFDAKMRIEANLTALYGELTLFLTKKQSFEIMQIIEPNDFLKK